MLRREENHPSDTNLLQGPTNSLIDTIMVNRDAMADSSEGRTGAEFYPYVDWK